LDGKGEKNGLRDRWSGISKEKKEQVEIKRLYHYSSSLFVPLGTTVQ
jgi:hypothetical protein